MWEESEEKQKPTAALCWQHRRGEINKWVLLSVRESSAKQQLWKDLWKSEETLG